MAKKAVAKKTVKKTVKKKATKKSAPKKRFNKPELKIYKDKLMVMRDDLIDRIKEMTEETLMKSQREMSGDISGYSLHLADMATDNYEREFNIGLVSSEREILFQIEEALKRIEEGTYGICQISGKPISKTRLNVIPYARYTKQAKEKLEKEGKL